MKTEFKIGIAIFICVVVIPFVWAYLSHLKNNKEQ
jgi:hypothetical protein